jgi:A/G-specific adenine glycosylase
VRRCTNVVTPGSRIALPPPASRAIRRRLLRWYRRFARALPWRASREPYRVWVSEIMLQQTRVGTAMPYFERFLRQFPDVRSLASTPMEKVLKAWEGMGYYSRARNLHRAARIMVADYGGELPRTARELQALPGIGPYTAGAIASIAFGLREPVLDGNVARVLCRLLCVRGDPSLPATRERLWAAARALLPRRRAGAGEFNQAMMDLGAMVCIPGRPRCAECPLELVCQARQAGCQDRLPVRRRRSASPHQTIVAGVIWRGGRILIARRRPEGLLGGLWEFPGGKVRRGETLEGALRREVREEVGIAVRVLGRRMTLRHAYTHLRITMHVMECRHVSGRARAIASQAVRWASPAELDSFAWPAANRKVVESLARTPSR